MSDLMIEMQERGWAAPDANVCPECLNDEYLASVAREALAATECDYCGRYSDEPVATPLEAVMPYVASALYESFADPTHAGLPRDSGEWVGEELLTDTQDALLSVGLEVDGPLFHDIANSFENIAWFPCAEGWWLGVHEHDRLRMSWESFVYATKYVSRYFFLSLGDENEHETYEPSELLAHIAEFITSFGLIRTIEAGQPLYRSRQVEAGTILSDFSNCGPPPQGLARAGRMNPAGISYFYTAMTPETATLEVASAPPCRVATATLEVQRALRLVDLTALPTLPSAFDIENKDRRGPARFLYSFVEAISSPVAKDGREHIDYVPSQVVCEYIAQVMELGDGNPPDGLVYSSSLAPTGINVVLFPPRDVLSSWQDLVRLIQVSHQDFDTWGAFLPSKDESD